MDDSCDVNVSMEDRASPIDETIASEITQAGWRREDIERAVDLFREIANEVSMMRAEHWRIFAKRQLAQIMTNCLEAVLTTALVPWTVWQWFSSNDHLVTILRIVLAVTLELTMWLVLAGVSIITAASFVLDDLYRITENADEFRRNQHRRHSCRISDDKSETRNTRLSKFGTPVISSTLSIGSNTPD